METTVRKNLNQKLGQPNIPINRFHPSELPFENYLRKQQGLSLFKMTPQGWSSQVENPLGNHPKKNNQNGQKKDNFQKT